MKKNPFLILILLLFSLVTNVSAANAPKDATLTVKMYKFYKGYPLEPELTYTGSIENITYSYKQKNATSFPSNSSNLTKDQLVSMLASESNGQYQLQVSCLLDGKTTTATTNFWIASYSNTVRDYGGPGKEETINTFLDFQLDVDRCVLKDAGGNIIIKLVKGGSGYYHLYVAPGVPLGDYELPIYQINTASQIFKLNVTVSPFERDSWSPECLPTLESALKELYTSDQKTITITLLADYSGEETTFNIDDGHDYILNLNGYNMSGNFTFNISNGSSLTINGDNEKTNLNATFNIVDETSTLTINGGRYTTDEDYCINIAYDNAKVTLNGGIFKGAKAATNKIYKCLNKTVGNETTFYLYEDGVKYAVGPLGDDGKEVFVEKCKTMPFQVDYYFKKHALGNYDNFQEYRGTKYFVTFEEATEYGYYDNNFNYKSEGSDECDLTATITLLDNYKGFKELNIPLGDNESNTNITIDFKSAGCIIDAKYNIQGGASKYGMGGGSRLTIIGDDNKTNIEGCISTSATNSMLTIYGGYYHNSDENFAVCVRKNGNANIYGGKFEATKTGSAGIMLTESNIVNIYGGRFLGNDYGMYIEKQPKMSNSKTTINGGYFQGIRGDGSYGLFIAEDNTDNSYPTVVNFGEFHGKTVAIYNKKNYSKGSNSFYYQLIREEGKEKETLRENAELSSGNLVYNSHSIILDVRIHKDVTPYVIPWVNEEEFEYISDIHGRWYADNNNAASTATNTKLTFMYDGYMPDENAWVVPEYKKGTTPSDPGWVGTRCENVSTVVFDESFKKYKPTSCYKWFFGFQSLIELEGIKEECNLNTENVISMSNMFYGCYKLNSLDLSTLNTEQVESMALMFFNCEKLENLKMGSTKNVQSFYNMFGYCNNLIGLDLSSFNTESATTMERMFGDCKLLKVVKFGKNFKPATNIGSMFYRCPALETIIVFGETWQSSYFNDVEVFTMCDKLVGGNGTKYKSTNKNNPDFFHIDGNNDIPGYLTKLPYTITYVEEDGSNATYEGLPTEYNPYDANISFFANNSSTPIELTPSKEGYHFVGWSDVLNTGLKDVTETVKIDPSVDRFNRIYKANWEIIPYTITYDLGGGELPQGAVNPSTYNIESHFTLYNPTLAGSEFLGWNDGSNATYLSSVEIKNTTGNMTWTAKWKKIQYTVTYKVGDKVYTTQNYEYGDAIVPPAENPTNGSYTFLDWYPELPKTCVKNLEVTAVWNDGNVTIAFDTQGGTLIPSITQQAGSKIENWPKDPEKENFVFLGWDKAIPTTMPTTNTTYTAKWKDKEYTITFDTKGGSEIKPISGTFGTLVTMPKEPTKTGYDFGEWSEIAAQIIEDKTITVIWKAHPYKITYNLDGGYLPNGKSNPETYTIESETFTLENPQKTGYTFGGWTFDNTTSKEVSIEKGTTGDKSFTAKWAVKIVATLSESASFPQDEIKYCKKEETSVLMDYTIESGNPTNYKVTLNDVETTLAIDNQQSIAIPITDDIKSGEYVASVVFLGDGVNTIDSDPYSITITATIPLRNAAVQLYTDMLIVDNHEGIYNAYQWYRNGEALSGATLQYYTEPKFDYNSLYTVKLSGDGKEMMSCPVEWLSTAKALKPSIKVYPNPAKQNENFTLEILDFDEDQNYDIVIFTANGTMVKKISNVEQKTSVTLPSGVYSGSLINGGEKKGFKLIVK